MHSLLSIVLQVLSKRATSVSVVMGGACKPIVTGDPALSDKVWTSVVPCEHIVIDYENPCDKTDNPWECIFISAPREENDDGKQWPTNSHKLVRFSIASDGIVPLNLLKERSTTSEETIKSGIRIREWIPGNWTSSFFLSKQTYWGLRATQSRMVFFPRGWSVGEDWGQLHKQSKPLEPWGGYKWVPIVSTQAHRGNLS